MSHKWLSKFAFVNTTSASLFGISYQNVNGAQARMWWFVVPYVQIVLIQSILSMILGSMILVNYHYSKQHFSK